MIAVVSGTTIMVLACLIVSIGQLSLGLVFPVLPGISQALAEEPERVQWLISAYLFAFGPVQLLYGPLSDARGRRPVLLGGLALALVGVALCMLPGASFEWLLAGRLLQGLGAGCGAVVSRAMLRDSFEGAALRNALSYIAMAAAITPVLAPALGGILNDVFGWQSVFIAMLAYLLLLWLLLLACFSETHRGPRLRLHPGSIIKNYFTLMRQRHFLGYGGMLWGQFALMMTSVSVLPYVMQQQIGMSAAEYGRWALLPALGLLLGGIINNRIQFWVRSEQILRISPFIQLVAGLWIMLMPLEPWLMVTGIFIQALGNGMAFPNAMSRLLEPYRDLAGSAAALSGALQMLSASILTAAMAYIGVDTAVSLGVCVIVGALVLKGLSVFAVGRF
ncbi:Bcr/CflA family efflux MFS transporter [Oceanimonas baumannii]|uniref:Bcr/CflA family efflux transporter n=1 Tax=Oceanimonas baumannii TaxID=129578 RepID=A0A235CJK4_9GAMM|nr:Bcr/CflA family efflux MFS transporter [Oceanimonas baumannii]OYD24636.1 MFS transporter [Oceanimonas baumannii]TDW59378.1 Bcr/CflA subfamily drug resistance transporter [Oceanimonas baumannii]